MANTEKIIRILSLYKQLISGKKINKVDFCNKYGINKRSFDRDIEDIRSFLKDSFSLQELIYDRKQNNYSLTNTSSAGLLGEESLILVYLLFSMKNIRNDELEQILSSILFITEDNRKEIVYKIISEFKKTNIKNKQKLATMKIQWDIATCIINNRIVKLNYIKSDGKQIERKVKPVDIIYDDGNMYLIGYRCDKEYKYPAFFRLDRILNFKLTSQFYSKELLNKYKKIDIKSNLKYMQSGELVKIILKCSKNKKNVIESSFRNVQLLEENEEIFIYEIQCFKEGFIQWIMGQSVEIEVLYPKEIRNLIYERCENILTIYKEGGKYGEKDKVSIGNE